MLSLDSLLSYKNHKSFVSSLKVTFKFSGESNLELCEYEGFLYKARHNSVHFEVLKSMGFDWTEEQPISNHLIVSEKYSNLSPDIFFKTAEGVFYIMDISVTFDTAKTKQDKESKYLPLLNDLKDLNNLEGFYIHLNFKSDYSNFKTELKKIKPFLVRPFNRSFIVQVNQIIDDFRAEIMKKVDQSFRNDYLNGRFDTFMTGIETEVRNPDVFINHVSEFFPEGIDIEQSCDNFKEEDLISFLGDVLEGEGVYSEIREKFRDLENNVEQYQSAYSFIESENKKIEHDTPRPTLHCLLPIPETLLEFKWRGQKVSEQKQLISLFKTITSHESDEAVFVFVKELFGCALESLEDSMSKSMFFTGFYFSKDIDSQKRKEYHLFREESMKSLNPSQKKERKRITQKSFREYLSETTLVDVKTSSFSRHIKSVHIPLRERTTTFAYIYDKTGIARKEKTHVPFTTVDWSTSKLIDTFISEMTETIDADYEKDLREYLYTTSDIDSPHSVLMKKEMIETFREPFEILFNTRAYWYSHINSLINTQLMHMSLWKSMPGTFHFFNCGIQNFCGIVAGCWNNLNSEAGKPFMFIVLTEYPQRYTEIFGKVFRVQLTEKIWFVATNWRRLPVYKLTHQRDAHYSVMSSTMNSYLSCRNKESYSNIEKFKYFYSYKTLISMCTSQHVAELLMDNRYAYMSAFSTHTNIEKLLIEKFKPPYLCALSIWIVKRMLNRLPLIFSEIIKGGAVAFNVPTFIDNQRSVRSVGGDINISSLWGDYSLTDVSELLDEAFVYVHTLKEPANIFHEEIKAVKTIIGFQSKYDNMTYKRKMGLLDNREDFISFLLDDNPIGCCVGCINVSTLFTLNKEKPDFKRIIDKVLTEPLSEIISTKAVIHDVERELIEIDREKKERRKLLERRKILIEKHKVPEKYLPTIESSKSWMFKHKSSFGNPSKPRQKVFETSMQILIENPNYNSVYDMVEAFILNSKGKVLADICIKSQYGAKREFYVVNIGAKALVRMMETHYKQICFNSPNEMISVPGDRKIMEMQKVLDSSYRILDRDKKMLFVNGDCTKWSAAETMASFYAMTYAQKRYLPTGYYHLIQSTYASWKNKEIQIPLNLLNKVIPVEGSTDYLFHCKDGKMKSTQNFLQGMFNYSSSYKSVCCSNYVTKVWKKLYPNSNLEVRHMEHSDDYVLIVVFSEKKEFEKYRILHKILMKFHGFNDSDRKTSCQFLFMEFVSLMSFNGMMLYPQIKKSKEVNLNLPCVGYKADVDSALSRMGECMRVGCSIPFLYFFEKWHMYCLDNAYSMLNNQTNCFNSYIERLRLPVELFGCPDVNPIFSLFCKGNINNYRLYHYGPTEIKCIIMGLYLVGIELNRKEGTTHEDTDWGNSLASLKYAYDKWENNILHIRKHIGLSVEEIESFWENHVSYRFLKPKQTPLLISWLKSMFYNRTFTEAYTKKSRTNMTMRISRYVKSKSTKLCFKPEDLVNFEDTSFNTLENNFYELRQLVFNRMTESEIELGNQNTVKILNRILTKCDPTVSAIYSYLDRTTFFQTTAIKGNLVATYTPIKTVPLNLINDPGVLLQFIYNKDDFVSDRRKVISDLSLAADITEIRKKVDSNLLESKETMDVLTVFNLLCSARQKKVAMLGFNRLQVDLEECLKDQLKNNFYIGNKAKVHTLGIGTIIDTMSNKPMYLKQSFMTIDYNRQTMDNLCLYYVYLTQKEKFETREVKDLFKKIFFKIGDREMSGMSLIEKYDDGYLKTHNIPTYEKKIAAFLKAVLTDDNTLLDRIANSIYSYTYEYEVIANKTSAGYKGASVCSFNYIGSNYKTLQIDENTPLLLTAGENVSNLKIIWNIALKLGNLITQLEFESEISKNRLTTARVVYSDQIREQLRPYIVRYCLRYDFIENKIVKMPFSDLKKGEEIMPIFITTRLQIRPQRQKYHLNKLYTGIEGISVYSEGRKLYTLPFWKCRTYPNVIVETIPAEYKFFQYPGVLENYLNSKEIQRIIPVKEFNSDLAIEYLSANIMYSKNYKILSEMLRRIDKTQAIINDLYSLEKPLQLIPQQQACSSVDQIPSLNLNDFFDSSFLNIDINTQELGFEFDQDIGILDEIEYGYEEEKPEGVADMVKMFENISFETMINTKPFVKNITISARVKKIRELPPIGLILAARSFYSNKRKTYKIHYCYRLLLKLTKMRNNGFKTNKSKNIYLSLIHRLFFVLNYTSTIVQKKYILDYEKGLRLWVYKRIEKNDINIEKIKTNESLCKNIKEGKKTISCYVQNNDDFQYRKMLKGDTKYFGLKIKFSETTTKISNTIVFN